MVSTSTRCRCGCIPRLHASPSWRPKRRRRLWHSICSPTAGSTFVRRRCASAAPQLERLLAGVEPPIYLTPMTRDPKTATDWLARFEGAGLDGVIAKPEDGVYEPGKRAMIKVKHARTADCVVAGFRWHKNGTNTRVGSLLLGLYDDEGRAAARRRHFVIYDGRARRNWSASWRLCARARSRIIPGASGRRRALI